MNYSYQDKIEEAKTTEELDAIYLEVLNLRNAVAEQEVLLRGRKDDKSVKAKSIAVKKRLYFDKLFSFIKIRRKMLNVQKTNLFEVEKGFIFQKMVRKILGDAKVNEMLDRAGVLAGHKTKKPIEVK